MLIFCSTQTIVERQHFSALKKHITWGSTQTWVTKISQSSWHIGNPDLFAGTHLLIAEKSESECCIIDRFIGTILEWSEHCILLNAVGGLRVIRNSTENLC